MADATGFAGDERRDSRDGHKETEAGTDVNTLARYTKHGATSVYERGPLYTCMGVCNDLAANGKRRRA